MTPRRHLAAVLSAFAILCALGAPFTTPDDVFYVGAAINLSQGGGLENPFIAPWTTTFHSEKFFFHPPLPSYVLATWLDLFGVSGISLRSFQWMAALIAAYSLDRFLRRFQASRLTRAVVEILLLYALFSRGLRFEPLGFALMLTGVALLDATRFRAAAGLFLIACAVQTVPWLLVYAVPLAVALPGTMRRWRELTPMARLQTACAVLLAGVCASGLLAIMVNLELKEFYRVFSHLLAETSTGPVANLRDFANLSTLGWQPLLAAPAFALCAACCVDLFVRPSSVEARRLVLGSMVASALGVIAYAIRAMPFVSVLAWLTIFVWLEARKRPAWMYLASATVLAMSHAMTIASLLVASRGPAQDVSTFREQVSSLPPGQVLLVDSTAARFVFDYRFPAGSMSWEFSRPFGQGYPRSLAERAPGTVWLIQKNSELMDLPVPVVLWGRTIRSVHAEPHIVALWK